VPGTSNPAAGSTSFGGVARNVAENLAVLLAGTGVTVELISAIGDDAGGAALLAHLGRAGVGVQHVRVHAGRTTAQYVAVLEPGGELVIGAAAMAVLDQVDVAAIDAAWPQAVGPAADELQADWLFCDCNLTAEVLEHVLARARRTGTPVAVDAVSTLKVVRLPADLRGLALLSCNRDEARAWLARHGFDPIGDDVQLARRLQAAGAAAVLLTRGSAGLIALSGDRLTRIPAVPATPVDVTGAGDALIAATLAALIGGAELAVAARAGAERAARTIESPESVVPG
jgi:pseudouridine kinase